METLRISNITHLGLTAILSAVVLYFDFTTPRTPEGGYSAYIVILYLVVFLIFLVLSYNTGRFRGMIQENERMKNDQATSQ